MSKWASVYICIYIYIYTHIQNSEQMGDCMCKACSFCVCMWEREVCESHAWGVYCVCVYVCVCLCACVCVYMCMRERERTHNVPAASAAAARTPILRLSIFRNLRIASIHPTINDVRTKSEDSDVPDFFRTPASVFWNFSPCWVRNNLFCPDL